MCDRGANRDGFYVTIRRAETKRLVRGSPWAAKRDESARSPYDLIFEQLQRAIRSGIMVELGDSERAYMVEMRMLTTDALGQETMVGLTPDEADFYILYARARGSGSGSHDAESRDRYLELHDKHERARLTLLMAENELRIDRPTRN